RAASGEEPRRMGPRPLHLPGHAPPVDGAAGEPRGVPRPREGGRGGRAGRAARAVGQRLPRPGRSGAARGGGRRLSAAVVELGRALRFVAPLRGRFALKIAFALLSIVPLLVLPVPIKLLIDHVIGDLPLAERIGSYPFLVRPFLRMMAGAAPETILWITVG